MRRRKESPARRAAAILLSAILIAGMLSNAVPTNVLAKEAADVSTDAETQKSGGDVTVPAGQETATESGDESGTKPVEEPGDAPEIKPANPAEGEGAPKPGEEPGAEPPVTGGQDGVSEPEPEGEIVQESEVMPMAALQSEISNTVGLDLTAEGYDGNVADFFQVGLRDGKTNEPIPFHTTVEGNRITCEVEISGSSYDVVWYLGETEYARAQGSGAGGGKTYSNIFYFVRFMDGTNIYDTKYAVKYVPMWNNFQNTVTEPVAPSKEGFTFAGWVTTEGGSELFDFSKQVTSATTLYASWTEDKGWTLDADGKLTISSEQGMVDWRDSGRKTYGQDILKAEILEGVTYIWTGMFSGCSNLTELTLPAGVTQIQEFAFQNCISLKEITLPASVTKIGGGAFDGCISLTEVNMKGEPPLLQGVVFANCGFVTGNKQGIHVPEGKAQTYKDKWTDWAAYIADDAPTPPVEKHEHNDVTFTPWTAADSLPTDAGNYYLTKDVTLTETWNVPSGETTLCLNGKTISVTGGNIAIQIDASCTLNLYDCQNAGNITTRKGHCGMVISYHGTFYMYGGKISGNKASTGGVMINGTFYMYGGEISDNDGLDSGGGVYCNSGTFHMYGGKISGNKTINDGCGVKISPYNDATFTVGGDAVISGNNTDDGKENNVYLRDGQTIEIDSSTPLSSSAKIGVKTKTAPTEGNPINITGHNKGDYSRFFTSDDPAYEIVNTNDVVQLAVKSQSHTHDYGDWQHDDTQHWKVCSCGEETDRADHNFGDWVTDREATTTEAGTKHRDCQTCGYSQTETIPAAGEKYTVTVNSGTGGGDYAAGDTVTIKANAPASGKQFNKWEVNSGSVTLASATNSTTTFTMPAEAVSVTATYKNKSGGGHSGGGSDSDDDHSGDNGNADGGDTNNGGGNADAGDNNHGGGDNGSGSSGGNGGAGQPGNTGGTGAGQPKVKQEKEGNIRKEVRVEGEDTLDAAVETPLSELADMVLTKEEKQKAAGGTDVKIVLDVKDASTVVSAADKTLVENALNDPQAKGYTLGQYLDISLYKVIGDSRNIITETNGKLTVTIDVPDSLKNTDATRTRTFAVIRVHGGKTELLPDLDDNADTITIKTDRFSTYAVVYKDTAGGKGDGGQSESGKPGVVRVSANSDGKNPGGGKDGEPKTEDRTPLELSATLAMIAGLTYLLLYFADRRHGMTEETKKELVSRMIGWAKQGGRIRKWLALAAIFVLLVYYHSIGKKSCAEWREVYGE